MVKLDKAQLKKMYDIYGKRRIKYKKMYDYYRGDTDAKRNYVMNTERSNLVIGVNFIKKFVDEEVMYTLGNDIVYESRSGNDELIEKINYHFSALNSSHDSNLLETMLITSVAYELYYVDHNGQFNAKVISPLDGFAILDEFGRVEMFMHFFTKQYDDKQYVDIYTNTHIYHYDEKWNEIKSPDTHIFGEVPVGIATWDREKDLTHKTIYATSKGLQDGYETAISDRINEAADFRNAQMVITGANAEEEDLINFKKLGLIIVPNSEAKVEWIGKDLTGAEGLMNSNQETLFRDLYEMNGHLSPAEKAQKGAESFLAIQARHSRLSHKTKSNQKAITEAIKSRIKFLIVYLRTHDERAQKYDFMDVYPVFVANLPTDDYSTADMIDKLAGNVSAQTLIGQLSFVKDPAAELEKVNEERKELFGQDYDFEDYDE